MKAMFQTIARRLLLTERDLEKAIVSSTDLEHTLALARRSITVDSGAAENVLGRTATAIGLLEAAQAAIRQAHRDLAVLYNDSPDAGHGIYGCLGGHRRQGRMQHTPEWQTATITAS